MKKNLKHIRKNETGQRILVVNLPLEDDRDRLPSGKRRRRVAQGPVALPCPGGSLPCPQDPACP